MGVQAQSETPIAESDTGNTAIQQEKEKIELEKLQLEEAELKLKLMKAQAQLSPVPTPTPQPNNNSEQLKQALDAFKLAESNKAEALAKDNKDKTDLLVLDLVNSEVWYKGIRYGMYEFNNLVIDQGWKLAQKVDERDPQGHARNLFTYQNVSLLKYENRDRGIFFMKAPLNTGDMDFLTPEGVSFASSNGDVRTNSENAYFTYDSQGEEKNQKVLKYRHGGGLGFNDQVQFWFDRQGKMTQIRYGVLGEH
jgi:hypothetical protein